MPPPLAAAGLSARGGSLAVALIAATSAAAAVVDGAADNAPASDAGSNCSFSPSAVSYHGLLLLQWRRSSAFRAGCGFLESQPSCGAPLMHTCAKASELDTRSLCPSDCSLVAADPYFPCAAACAAPKNCHELAGPGASFGDLQLQVCRRGPVTGCRVYVEEKVELLQSQRARARNVAASPPAECAECLLGYELTEDGTCYFDFHGWRSVFVPVFLVVVVLILLALPVNFYRMCCLPKGDPELLSMGWEHRTRCLVSSRGYNDPAKDMKPFPLTTNMHKELVAGSGLCIYYNTLWFTGEVALVASAFTLVIRSLRLPAWVDPQAAGTCSLRTAQSMAEAAGDVASYQTSLMCGLFLLWLVLVAMSLTHAARQHRAFREIDKKTSLMSDFGMMITGLPPDATETEIEEYLNKFNPGAIVGVSIAYDCRGAEATIENLLDRHLHEMDLLYWSNNSPEEVARIRQAREGWRGSRGEDLQTFLGGLKGSGTAFAVFRTEVDRERLQAAWGVEKPLLRKRYALEFTDVTGEPQTFFWYNFSFTTQQRVFNSLREVLILGVLALVLCVLIYVPAARYILNEVAVTGDENGGGWVFQSLGLLIAAVNGVLFVLVDASSRRIGFRWKDEVDVCNCIGCVVIVMVNTAFNIYVNVYAAMAAAGVPPPEDGAERVVRDVVFRALVAKRIWALMFPGLLLVPYVLYPLYKHLLSLKALLSYWVSFPFWPIFSKRDLRTNPRLTLREAERGLEPEPIQIEFDYANIVCVTSTVFVLLFFENSYVGVGCLVLFVWVVWTYCVQIVCHLRWDKLVEHTTPTLNDAVNYLWAIPVSVVAAGAAHWAAEAGDHGVGLPTFMFITALVVHWIALYAVLRSVPSAHDESRAEYAPTRKLLRYDYFNTNPVHVLKSRFCKVGTPLVYFQRGKEYLQRSRQKGSDTSSVDSEATSVRSSPRVEGA